MTNDFRESILVWQRTQAEDQCSDIFPRLIPCFSSLSKWLFEMAGLIAGSGNLGFLLGLIQGGKTVEVAKYLTDHRELNLNAPCTEAESGSPLMYACFVGVDMVDVFLTHSPARVDVNFASPGWWPPVMCVQGGRNKCVQARIDAILRRLLGHPSLKIDVAWPKPLSREWSCFALAVSGSLRKMKLIIGSGKALGWTPGDPLYSLDEPHLVPGEFEDRADLLRRFEADATGTRHAIQLELAAELGCEGDAAAYAGAVAHHHFACVVFLCDAFLRFTAKPTFFTEPHGSLSARRFFRMATSLPIELQMVLSHRHSSSGKDVILTGASETAFRHLASVFECG